MIEGSTEINPPLIRCEELGREIQVDLAKWESLAIDQRNLLFWQAVPVARIQNDSLYRAKDGKWQLWLLA